MSVCDPSFSSLSQSVFDNPMPETTYPNVLIACRNNSGQNYTNAAYTYGMHSETSLTKENLSSFDGLILPGGGDIEPALYGCENTSSHNIDFEEDLAQLDLISYFILHKKPILGICKGIQILNVFFGGTLIQHLKSAEAHSSTLNGDHTHLIRNTKNSFLYPLYSYEFTVNSAHHQGISQLGNHLLVDAYAQDGVVEALHHDTLPIFGVQWHPERMCLGYGSSRYADGGILLSFFRNLMMHHHT